MKKLNEAALDIEKIKAVKDVEIRKAETWAEAIKAAQIKINHISGQDGNILGIPFGPQAGGSFAQALEAFNAVVSPKTREQVKDAVSQAVGGVKKAVKLS